MRRKRIPPTGRRKLNLEDPQELICMSKLLYFAELAPNIGFSEFDFYDLYRSTFAKSELGRMKNLLPLHAMAENFGLVSKSLRPKLGRKSYFTAEGKVALMFLKMYTDATCYECDMRYPTDPKLLWEGERPCQTGTCQGEGDSDGGLVRHTERALRPKASQGPDEVDGNPVHLLRHPHSKRGAAGRQDRAESTAGGLLKRKYAHEKVLSQGELRLCHREWTKNPAETIGMRYKKRNFGDPNAEMDGISRLLRSKQKNDNP